MTVRSARLPGTDQPIRPMGWVRQHPVWAFTLLSFALSWLVWGVLAFFAPDQDSIQIWGFRLGTFGPAIAAMILAWLLNPTPTHIRPVVWWLFFLAGSLFGWLYYSWKGDISYNHFPLAAYILAALTMAVWGCMVAGIAGRTQGVRGLMRRQIKFPGWRWIALVVFFPLFIEFVGLVVTNLTGGHVRPWLINGSFSVIAPLIMSVMVGTWITGGGNEEPGWRGFMQAYLQKQHSPLVAATIVGVVMGLWHFPLHFMGYYAGNDLYTGINGLIFRILSNIVFAIGFGWLYNRSRGSLLLVMLFHVVVNTSSVFIASTTMTQVLMFVVFLALILLDRMWKKLPPETAEALLQSYSD